MRRKRLTLNDQDREQWVRNDEGLYRWWLGTRKTMRQFVRENRANLTQAIMRELNREPAR